MRQDNENGTDRILVGPAPGLREPNERTATVAAARIGRALPFNELKSLRSLDLALARAGTRTRHFASAHPKSLSAAVMLALAGFGVTAFGIAPMAPDAAAMPKRIVIETVPLDGIRSQLDALAEQDLQLYRSDLTRPATRPTRCCGG